MRDEALQTDRDSKRHGTQPERSAYRRENFVFTRKKQEGGSLGNYMSNEKDVEFNTEGIAPCFGCACSSCKTYKSTAEYPVGMFAIIRCGSCCLLSCNLEYTL